ncbi:hypothetical protein Tco_1253696 [Tanacetum coccineum]
MRIRLREDYKSFPMILRLFSDLLCSFIHLLFDLGFRIPLCIPKTEFLDRLILSGLETRRYAVSSNVGYGVLGISSSTDTPYLLDGYGVLR